jgi:lysophospholipase L1-like esterase
VAALTALAALAIACVMLARPAPGGLGHIVLTTDEQPHFPSRVVVIGDSLTAGAMEGGMGPLGWPELTWNTLRSTGIDVAPNVSGRGGSGYVHRGLDGTVYPEEAERLVWPDDTLVVFFGSRNDAPEPIDAIGAQANRAFAETRHTAPHAALLVIGPVWFDLNPPAEILAIRDTLRDQTHLAGGIFVDPIEERWFVGHPELIGADGRHPNNAGHQYLAEQIAPRIRGALPPIAQPD